MSSLPRAFHQIRLELSREPEYSAGNAKTGYLITAPLDAAKHLDAGIWKDYRDNCRVVRFRKNDRDVGHLIREPDGNWRFRYDISGDNAEEAGFNLQKEKFVPGEYISIWEGDLIHTYRVVSVEHL
jgi:hypothetical protein